VDGRWGDPAPFAAMQEGVDDPASAGRFPKPLLTQMKWTVEVTMDVQLVGRLCPGAEIVVYFAANNNQGEYWAFSEALYGPFRSDVLSCSWGSFEPGQDQPDRLLEISILDSLLLDAGLLGTTVCVSSGDRGDGSGAGHQPPLPTVEFPAASPWVLACGGTMFRAGVPQGEELVWDEDVLGAPMASGGGYSRVFPRPHWQQAALTAAQAPDGDGRGVPDVASKADVTHGFCMMVAGRDVANGGTSAAAPIWAGLLSLAAARVGASLGHLNPHLYGSTFGGALRSVDEGTNGCFHARSGWDPCTGLGSPDWETLCAALEGRTEQA
jgi:kumamolisin